MSKDMNNMQTGIFPSSPEDNNTPLPMESDVSTLLVANIMNQLMRPLLEDIGKLLKNNTEAMEQIATSQDVMRNRLEALEKQMRLQTPVTDRQARYLADYARNKAKAVLFSGARAKAYPFLKDDKKALNKLTGIIKKDVLMWRGVGSLREIPKCEYEVAVQRIETWNNAAVILEITSEAIEREKKAIDQANKKERDGDAE